MSKRIVPSMFGIALLVTLLASAASAQLQRTFVSGRGSDSNPCSRTAPCRTFGQAILQTNAGGEVAVLDSAGYGAFTINKAVSIVAPPGVYAGISVFSGDGIDINAGPSDRVILRGLTLNNQGSTGSGIAFNSGALLHVEGCVMNGFFNDAGLSLLAGGTDLEVIDSIMRDNDAGILLAPSSGTALATIDHVRLDGNMFGLLAFDGSQVAVTNSVATVCNTGLEASCGSGSIQMNVEGTVLSSNAGGIGVYANGTGTVQVNVARCVISNNIIVGINATSDSTGVATVRVSSSTVTGNDTGLRNDGSPAVLLSRGDNTVEGNTHDTFGTIGPYTAK